MALLLLTGCGSGADDGTIGYDAVQEERERVQDDAVPDESSVDENTGGGEAVNYEPVVYEPVAANVSFGDVRALAAIEPDARVSYGDDALQVAELTRPRSGEGDGAAGAPVIVFLHGGCWLNSFGVDHTRALATALTQEGFAVWNLEYRRTGDAGGGWPGSFLDIQAGMRRLAEIEDATLDLSRVVVAGHSAGGHLALLAGNWLRREPIEGLQVRGIVGLAAIVDLATYATGTGSCQQAAVQFMGAAPQEEPELYGQANPAGQPFHPHTVLIQGTADQIVPLAQARDAGLPVEWVAEAGHFDLIHPGTPAWRVVISTLRKAVE